MDAARAGHTALLGRLLTAGADPARHDLLGRSALHAAAQTGSLEAVRLLAQLPGTAGRSQPADDGSTALHTAAREGHDAVCQLLVELGEERTARDAHGRTAADVARIHRHEQLARRLEGGE